MSKETFVKNIAEDLVDDLPFTKCDDDCKVCESICEEFFRSTQVAILHRIAKREYEETKPEYRRSANIDIKLLCDIFGWTDFDFSKETA